MAVVEREPSGLSSLRVCRETGSLNWRVEVDRGLGPPAPERRRGSVAWYVPYTQVHLATVAGAPKDAVWVDVSAHEHAYWSALREMWAYGRSFALLEHDVVCRSDVVEAFETRPEPWLAFGYDDICHPACMEAWANTLGCTRFTAELVRAVPDAVSSIPPDGRDWHGVCDFLGRNLRAAGFSHAWGFPWVEHHHMGRHKG
jgi:hypothetical protein